MANNIHHLIADDNGVNMCQAIFEERGNGKVFVIGITGAVGYFKDTLSKEEARAKYRELVNAGWVVPVKTKKMTIRQMELHIHS